MFKPATPREVRLPDMFGTGTPHVIPPSNIFGTGIPLVVPLPNMRRNRIRRVPGLAPLARRPQLR